MSRLPALTGKQLVAVLQQLGFESLRVKGSHHFLRHPDGRTTVVPIHAGETIGPGLLNSIFANNVSVGYFAAECRARVTARIHSQGPEAIRIQIQQSGQLLAVVPVGAALSDWGEPGLASP